MANLFYSLFLHAGLLHLAGNMLFLWIYGDNVEHRLGRFWYLVAYLGTGVARNVVSQRLRLRRRSCHWSGASGAISGVLGFYFSGFRTTGCGCWSLFFPFLVDVIMVPARLVLGMFLIVDNLLPFLATRGMESGGVAYGAHIGGFLVGLLIAWLMDRRALAARPARVPADRRRRRQRHACRGDSCGDRRGPVRRRGARSTLRSPRRRHGGSWTPEQSLALADWLRRNGSNEAALAVYRRHLRDYPNGPGAAEAHLGAGLVLLDAFDQPTPAYQHFLEGLELDPPPDIAAQLRAAIDAVAARQKFQVSRWRRGG